MIICLKGISEECFSFSGNVNASLKFLWALRGLSEGTQILGYSKGIWALVQSEGPRALGRLRHTGTGSFRVLRHLGTQGAWTFGHLGTRGTLISRLEIYWKTFDDRKLYVKDICLFKHVAKKKFNWFHYSADHKPFQTVFNKTWVPYLGGLCYWC